MLFNVDYNQSLKKKKEEADKEEIEKKLEVKERKKKVKKMERNGKNFEIQSNSWKRVKISVQVILS